MPLRKRHPKTTERVAYCEAGHALAAHHFGLECPRITIVPDTERETQGEILLKRTPRSLHEALLMHLGISKAARLKEALVILMAGIEAVNLIWKQTGLQHW